MSSKKNSHYYADHIFGDLEQPKKSAQWLRNNLQGVNHGNQKVPANPNPGDTVKLLVTTGNQQVYDRVKLWYSTDDWETQTSLNFSKTDLTWDTTLWSYLQHWTVTLPPCIEGGVLRYKILAEIDATDSVVFADNQAGSFKDATHFSIFYTKKALPDWAKSAIVYQIFVDRFNPGEGNSWVQTSDLRKPFGGTLKGITEKLTWIKSMGFNTIWLTPIFESPSHHGYDTTDYFRINSRLGDIEDFNNLVKTAHQIGVKVILDFVANHCSNQHPSFVDALTNPKSTYHDWFVWKKWPDYDCFYNVKRMPKLNLKFGFPARKYLLEAAQFWLKLGVDGFRLDHANGPEQDFWVDFRNACQAIKDDVWTFGEVVAPADVQATFANGINGTLDFLLCDAMRHTFALGDWKLSKFAGFLETHFSYFPEYFSLPSFIDNHDMNRFFFSAKENKPALMLALLLLYNLPHPPIIYYGTETTLPQNKSIHAPGSKGFDETRVPMNWNINKNEDLFHFLKRLSEIRIKYPLLSQTPWCVQQVDDQGGTLVLKKRKKEMAYLILNQSTRAVEIEIPQREFNSYMDLLAQTEYQLNRNNKLSFLIPPQSGKVLIGK